jgi:glycerol transport system ATP-binding protein
MARIELKNLYHSYEVEKSAENMKEFSINDLDIAWEDGTANALLGPSGCGKTTLLNIISGLVKPKGGQVLFDGKDVTGLAPRERHIAQVFQFPVIYDSMNVYNNIAFPLRNDGVAEPDVRKRVNEVAQILDLGQYLKYSTADLGLTEKQKVSLARGIARENTSAVLLDEPLTVIDHKLKYTLRRKLKEVQRLLKMTMIYVTHDQHEALTFADHVTLMKDGKILQSSSPEELHSNPQTPFCGYFIGSPGMNVLNCILSGNRLEFGGVFSVEISRDLGGKLAPHGNEFQFGIRPEYIATSRSKKIGWPSLKVTVVEDTGAYKVLTMMIDGLRMKARVPEADSVPEGGTIYVSFPEDKVKIFKEDRRVH